MGVIAHCFDLDDSPALKMTQVPKEVEIIKISTTLTVVSA